MHHQPYSQRPFAGAQDLQEMIALLTTRPPGRRKAFPTLVDLQEISGAGDGQAGITLWRDGAGRLLGFSLLTRDFFAFELHPEAGPGGLADQMIAGAVDALRGAAGADEPGLALVTASRGQDQARIAFLEQRGFTALPDRTLHFSRPLGGPLPAPVPPDGFTIRAVRGEEEVDAWLAVHYAAHGREGLSADFRRAMMRTPEYRRDLDLVAAAPDGRLAAYAVCHFSSAENAITGEKVGHTDPVATHPDFQKMGLARALLFEGFRRLKECGMEAVELSTSEDNTGMVRAALSAGFRQCDTTLFFTMNFV